MDLHEIKGSVVRAGRELAASGLIARTWGNVSCRINGRQFAITPSGRLYHNLTAADIVVVNIADGSYEGEIKPSSEKGIHAAVYSRRRDINFIIHTHQVNASIASVLGQDLDTPHALVPVIGDIIACAAYGLPGSKKLKNNIIAALERSSGKAFLLANHGALCFGRDEAEAFTVAFALEEACAYYMARRYLAVSGRETVEMNELRELYLLQLARVAAPAAADNPEPLFSSERDGDHFILYPGAAGNGFPPGSSSVFRLSLAGSAEKRWEAEGIPAEAEIHRQIYKCCSKCNAVIHTAAPDIHTISRTGQKLLPLLDDFAQMLGTSVETVEIDRIKTAAVKIARKLKGRNAVLIKDRGALCTGPTKDDAAAAVMVLEKGCKAAIATAFWGKVKPLNPLDSILMRLNYQYRYARLAAKK
ncbi:MAG: class II aldolase/adducin family protein [Firmicutes bacterium]|jgi:L-fuculose-phosphate aldolase|nr:class II aldolase/adducin family protein [Bacillota bacterium]